MLVLGLTGPTGGGKGTFAKVLSSMGIPIFDADAEYHHIVDRTSDCVRALKNAFGSFILKSDGSLDRKILGKYVFCGGEEQTNRIRMLTSITHPFVLERCYSWLEEKKLSGHRIAVLDAPLLCEAGLDRKCDYVITVIAPKEVRIARIMLRDGIDESAARARIAAQPSDDYYISRAHYVIYNDSTEGALVEKAKALINKIS